MDPRTQPGSQHLRELLDARRYPRFKLQVDIRIYPRESGVIHGKTVDICESGIAAILKIEIAANELVRLEFTLPFGEVETFAIVRQRSAFRYGFQFVPSFPAQTLIERTCRHLAVAGVVHPQG